ncbi:hypothetical protein ABID19_005783 [Mesorhizobium robiniae]|uniref:Uncharacterized protein n=1 Tax=Mesorhizobium robiniae TaxID=559315 RepID=A0ABV2GWQ4_9HYPH|nr:hypothetical protein [Mesorhizobium sp. ZC-5]MCV3242056.1 hypothetical protein [Mesorhizobium sp. ZC-5]
MNGYLKVVRNEPSYNAGRSRLPQLEEGTTRAPQETGISVRISARANNRDQWADYIHDRDQYGFETNGFAVARFERGD